ncbi:MAG: SDR family oxidoreductase [Myxococcota bacterium]
MTKTIWITGVSRGLGRALAEQLAADGHKVAGCSRQQRDLDKLKLAGGPHLLQAADVLDEKALEGWMRAAVEKLGPPDLLINNAGAVHKPAPLWEIPRDDVQRVLDVNIRGVINVLRAAVPHFLKSGKGVIANISSGWGRSADAGMGAFCASKFAVEGLTQALAKDLPRGVVAVAVNPGAIDTDMLRTCFGDEAGTYPAAKAWAAYAAGYFLSLAQRDHGKSVTVQQKRTDLADDDMNLSSLD